METAESCCKSAARTSAQFPGTHWSVVLAAGDPQSPASARALETLCRTYWFPLYAFLRRRGSSTEDAQDLTQEFLARLLSTHALSAMEQAKGRFRSFLLASLNHFLANEWDKARTLKRGGGQPIVSLDAAESRYRVEPSECLSPDCIFARQWALTLLAQVVVHLREDYHAAGKGALFEALQIYLSGEKGLPPYRETATGLGLSCDALKKAVERLRHRYGELLREEIAHTVSDPAEVDEEIRYLRSVLASP
ncbi:MAG TPA: sigma factor [Candidatus Paceibacterota bacterium]|nr:sigma factor [Candidatus Paceibacterota bacterium]